MEEGGGDDSARKMSTPMSCEGELRTGCLSLLET